MQLNPKQEEAKKHINGPLLIIAGAGSGKTATLTSRVEYMIKEKQILPSSILCVTFTNKAAREMRERISSKLGVELSNNIYKNRSLPLIGTFHSIGVYILKDVISKYDLGDFEIGIKKDFVIYDESDKLSVLKTIIKEELNLDEKQYPARQIAFYISNAKNSLISSKAYEQYIDSPIKEIVFQVYEKYEKRLSQNNAIDFDDILIKTLALLNNQSVLSYYHERFEYIMVDEYQDTNAPQYRIVNLLASKHKNLAVVGDDRQSIYSWRGADMRNILNFKKDYVDVKIVKLEQNYRSTKTIITSANEIIKNNSNSLKKELWTDNIEGEKIKYIEALDDKTEANTIAEIIIEKHDSGSQYSDNLILYRTNGQSRQIEESLMVKGIPYRVIGGLKFYDRKEVKDMLCYLKVILNPDDIVSIKRIINTPSRKIGSRSIEILDNYRNNFGVNYINLIENIDEIEELKPQARASLKEFYALYKSFSKVSFEVNVSELLKKIINDIGYEDYLKQNFSKEEFDSKLDNLSELENVTSEYNGMEARESLSQFLEEVALITDLDQKNETEKEDYVTLMTVHTSKGLEYNRVFITGLEEGIFPHIRSINDPVQLEEERRLMYVAMTRARQELYISRAKERFYFGDYVRNPESRFIKELPKQFLEAYEFQSDNSFFSNSFGSISFESTGSVIKKTREFNDVGDFSLGDKVSHHKFGNGVITELNGEVADIAFSGIGIKKMNIRIAPVKKV